MTKNKKKTHPNTGKTYALKHGAHSHTVRKRWDDRRSREGAALHNIMQNLITDLVGGESNLTAPMRVMLDANIRPKLITLMIVNDFVNKQNGEIINDKGELLPVLGSHFLAWSNSLRLDLQTLCDMAARAGKNSRGVPSIEELIAANKT